MITKDSIVQILWEHSYKVHVEGDVVSSSDFETIASIIMENVQPTQPVKVEEPLPDKYHFRCKCGKIHKMNAYCVAQLASGYAINHTCECGNKNSLEPELIK